jgi:hypothetical protein
MQAGESIGYFNPKLTIFEATEMQHHKSDQIYFYKKKELFCALSYIYF